MYLIRCVSDQPLEDICILRFRIFSFLLLEKLLNELPRDLPGWLHLLYPIYK